MQMFDHLHPAAGLQVRQNQALRRPTQDLLGVAGSAARYEVATAAARGTLLRPLPSHRAPEDREPASRDARTAYALASPGTGADGGQSPPAAVQAFRQVALDVAAQWREGAPGHWPRPSVRGVLSGPAPMETAMTAHATQGEQPASARVPRCLTRDVRAVAALLAAAEGGSLPPAPREGGVLRKAELHELLHKMQGGVHSSADLHAAHAILDGNLPSASAGLTSTTTDPAAPGAALEIPRTADSPVTTVPMLRCSQCGQSLLPFSSVYNFHGPEHTPRFENPGGVQTPLVCALMPRLPRGGQPASVERQPASVEPSTSGSGSGGSIADASVPSSVPAVPRSAEDPTSLRALRRQATELGDAFADAADASILPAAMSVQHPALARTALSQLSRPTAPSSATFGSIQKPLHDLHARRGFARVARHVGLGADLTGLLASELMQAMADELTADSRPAFSSVGEREGLRCMLREAGVQAVEGAGAREDAEQRAVKEHCRLPVPGLMDMPTTNYSWFAGYAWQCIHCPRCLHHLGFAFKRLDYLAAAGEPYRHEQGHDPPADAGGAPDGTWSDERLARTAANFMAGGAQQAQWAEVAESVVGLRSGEGTNRLGGGCSEQYPGRSDSEKRTSGESAVAGLPLQLGEGVDRFCLDERESERIMQARAGESTGVRAVGGDREDSARWGPGGRAAVRSRPASDGNYCFGSALDGGRDSDSEEDLDLHREEGPGYEEPAARRADVLLGAAAMRRALVELAEAGAYAGSPLGRVVAPEGATEAELLRATEESCRRSRWPLVFFGLLASSVGVGLPHLWPPMREPGLAPVRIYDPRDEGPGSNGPSGDSRAAGTLRGCAGRALERAAAAAGGRLGEDGALHLPPLPPPLPGASSLPALNRALLQACSQLMTPWHVWGDEATPGTLLAMQRAAWLGEQERTEGAPGGARVASQVHCMADATEHVVRALLRVGTEGVEGSERVRASVRRRTRRVAGDVAALSLLGPRALREATRRLGRVEAGGGGTEAEGGGGPPDRATSRAGGGSCAAGLAPAEARTAAVAVVRTVLRKYAPGCLGQVYG